MVDSSDGLAELAAAKGGATTAGVVGYDQGEPRGYVTGGDEGRKGVYVDDYAGPVDEVVQVLGLLARRAQKDTVWSRHWLTGLAANTQYEWQIKTVCRKPFDSGTQWSAVQNFTTAPSAKNALSTATDGTLRHVHVYPNPSAGQTTLLKLPT